MGLQQWFILSKHAEEKKIRTNLKKLGCLFEAFLGAMFLDFNESNIGNVNAFEVVRCFLEKIFEKHIDWAELICSDDNYKNILQVKIQREFKVTPQYLELSSEDPESKFCMGVFLCIGQEMFQLTKDHAISIEHFRSYQEIHTYAQSHEGKVLVFLGQGQDKIKKKAEQLACFHALHAIKINISDNESVPLVLADSSSIIEGEKYYITK